MTKLKLLVDENNIYTNLFFKLLRTFFHKLN
jgi:hypothetical protein